MKRIRTLLDRVAYASLMLDIIISIITIASVNIYAKQNLSFVLSIVDYALTGVVIISVLLFAMILLLSHYDRLLEMLIGKRH
ncbi:MAG: hypothetical protein M1562_00245 [Candidatus Marsarchaeota archaeon]|nr:hypothetical protein [Candidatus Marsarchaeota archaeon]